MSIPTVADETTTLRAFLDHFRDTLRRQCAGVGADGLAWSLPPATMTLGGMLKHLTFVEQWWFSIVLHGHEPSGIWADVDWEADEDWDWHSAVQDSPDQLRTWLDEAIATSDRLVDGALARGEGLAAEPQELAFHAGLVMAFVASLPDEVLEWPGGARTAWTEAAEHFERAKALGHPRADAIAQAAWREVHRPDPPTEEGSLGPAALPTEGSSASEQAPPDKD